MSEHNIPHVGLRTIKTALAVMICTAIFLPFHLLQDQNSDPWSLIGPLNACVAAIICMQSSIEDSWQQGFIRLRGTAIGGMVGIVVISLYLLFPYPPLLIPLLGLSTVAIIWFCNLIKRPRACGLGCIVCCIVILSPADSGIERYLTALARMGETAVGILISILINRLLPGLPPVADSGDSAPSDPVSTQEPPEEAVEESTPKPVSPSPSPNDQKEVPR